MLWYFAQGPSWPLLSEWFCVAEVAQAREEAREKVGAIEDRISVYLLLMMQQALSKCAPSSFGDLASFSIKPQLAVLSRSSP